MRFSADLSDRALYRTACRRAAEAGPHVLRRFFDKQRRLFAGNEVLRVTKAAVEWGWDNIARAVAHQFRANRGEPHDAGLLEKCLIVHVLITPHLFLRHVL